MNKEQIKTDNREFFAVILWGKNTRCCPIVIRSYERVGKRPLNPRVKILRSASVDDIFLPDWPGINLRPEKNQHELIVGHPPLLEAARSWLLSRKQTGDDHE